MKHQVLLFGNHDSFMYIPAESSCLTKLTRKIYEGKILGFNVVRDVHLGALVVITRKILPVV